MLSLLTRILPAERYHQPVEVGGKVPLIFERHEPREVTPTLVSNSKGEFLVSRRSRTGMVRCGVSPVALTEEARLVTELVKTAWDCGEAHQWPNRFATLDACLVKMRESGLEPAQVVIPYNTVSEFKGPDFNQAEVDKLMAIDGRIGTLENLNLIAVPSFPDYVKCRAAIFAKPDQLGIFTRMGDFLGVSIHNANRTVLLVT